MKNKIADAGMLVTVLLFNPFAITVGVILIATAGLAIIGYAVS